MRDNAKSVFESACAELSRALASKKSSFEIRNGSIDNVDGADKNKQLVDAPNSIVDGCDTKGKAENLQRDLDDIVDGDEGGAGEEKCRPLIVGRATPVDWWLCDRRQVHDMHFVCSLLRDDLPEYCLPTWHEGGGTSFLFMPDGECAEPHVLDVDGQCLPLGKDWNLAWEDALNNVKNNNLAICFPSSRLKARKVLVSSVNVEHVMNCLMRDSDDPGVSRVRSFFDTEKGRHVFWVGPNPMVLLRSLRENAWWDRLNENGRFHFVLCNLNKAQGGAHDASSPVAGVLANFKSGIQQFYPGAWRFVLP